MYFIRRFFFFCVLILTSIVSFAQQTVQQKTDIMNSNGKIYVVMAVVITIVLGLFIYLFMLDRKVSKFEKEEK